MLFLSILVRMRVRETRSVEFGGQPSLLKPLPRLSWWVLRLVLLAAIVAMPFQASVSQIQENNGLAQPVHDPSGLPPLSPLINRHPDNNRLLEDAMKLQDNRKRFAQLNLQRQKEMTNDTAKLLALANRLKSQMEPTSKNALSVESLREAEQIEKLAHSVQDKMKATVSN